MSRGLSPATRAAIATDAHLSRHQWTSDPGPVVEELDDSPAVRDAAASWAGHHGHMPECRPLVDAVIQWVGEDHPSVAAGRRRASAPWHGAP